MSFSSSHSLTLPYPLPQTVSVLGEPTSNEAVARLSPVCTVYEQRGPPERVWITDDDLGVEMTPGRKTLGELELVVDGERGEERGGEGEERRVVERVSFFIRNEIPVPLYTHVVDIEGHRVWDPRTHTILYTSKSTTSPQITTRWLRRLSPSIEDPERSTVVSEEIRGTAPTMLRWLTEKETRKGQKVHMGGYASLF